MKPVQKITFLSLIFALILSGCSLPASAPVSPSPSVEPTLAPTAIPEQPTPTPEPVDTSLSICLGQEPNSLYPFDVLNSAARSVLSAIYDGPVDVFSNGYQPVILERLPSIANQDAQLVPVQVTRGDLIIDASGKRAYLNVGTTYFPSGCSDENCAVIYDGRGEVTLDQMAVTFRMMEGLTWSDGQPLTAEDSIYAYQLASDPATPGSKYLVDRTQSYELLDEKTVQWWSVPGYVDPTYADNFWSPLPKHLWGSLGAADLAAAGLDVRPALGWGPYILDEWVPSQYIKLNKNPNYFGAELGFPRFDTLVFRFLPDAESGISALTSGECDVLDSSLRIDGQLALLTEMERNDQVQLFVASSPLLERLDIGIRPASYEDGYNILLGDRPDFFADVRTRQAIAYCLDRQKIVDTVLAGYVGVPNSYIPDFSSLYSSSVAVYEFDPAKGLDLLEQAGWVDDDNNPATPLKAGNVFGVPSGTVFSIKYGTTEAAQRRQVSEILVSSLATCGIQVAPEYLPARDFYAAGPVGPLFGRKFDLAEYAIGTSDTEPPCAWFLSDQIPAVNNTWLGVNVSGYNNSDFDSLCQRSARVLPDSAEYASTHARLQEIFANDLPSIPLYFRLKVVAARPGLCNISIDSININDWWNIEELDSGVSCKK